MKFEKRASKGQGIVEYAGALVVATSVIAAVILVGPGAIGTLFTDIITTISAYLEAQVNAAVA